MAHKCGECGSTDTSTGLHSFTCLTCGATTEYKEQADIGRIPNPDGPATYATDQADVAEPEEPKKKSRAKAT